MAIDPEVLALYQSMVTADLLHLKRAFELDKEAAKRMSTVAFCEQRIAWIDMVLSERKSESKGGDKQNDST